MSWRIQLDTVKKEFERTVGSWAVGPRFILEEAQQENAVSIAFTTQLELSLPILYMQQKLSRLRERSIQDGDLDTADEIELALLQLTDKLVMIAAVQPMYRRVLMQVRFIYI